MTRDLDLDRMHQPAGERVRAARDNVDADLRALFADKGLPYPPPGRSLPVNFLA